MVSRLLPLIVISWTAGCVSAGDRPDSGKLRVLFNSEDLSGWVIENGGQFSVRKGLLVVNRGTGWLRSEGEFGDFVLDIDFRFLEKEANSGIFVRTGSSSADDENGWPDNGYQVQCMDTTTGERPLASMIPYGAPGFYDTHHKSNLEAIARVYRPTGEWNNCEIACIGETLSVKLNGELVTTASNVKNRRGHIGIQAEHGLLEFRNIIVRAFD